MKRSHILRYGNFSISILSILLTGCMTQTEAMRQDIGPSPANYKAQIEKHLQRTLVDPESMRGFYIDPPQRGTRWEGVNGGARPVWISCVGFNSKNRMGGYGGFTDYKAIFTNGRLETVEDLRIRDLDTHSCTRLGPR